MFIIRSRNRNNSIHHTKGFRRPVIAALLLAMTGSGHVLGIELQTEVEQHEGRYLQLRSQTWSGDRGADGNLTTASDHKRGAADRP